MTPDERSLLERTHQLAKENNEMLIKMRRSSRVGLVIRITYWIIILALSFGTFYFIQPYINQLMGVYQSTQQDYGSVKTALGKFNALFSASSK